ncbi:hypothetical protein DASC09_036390 [Saccharomycopsis crataegensis]|uniref:C2H2-type domain-containing protein n=1 Tax=Saccharomycopsis crataegensis TaxID=43959 RepID=A0AAV5QPC9_9ASCO|nr:hypothetical protein DASC09_036390 [Saccharomycopsis crataegensis]
MPPTRRYICSFCAKSFSRSEHKSRHERSHTNEKPFGCTICFAKFVRRDLLQRHLRTVHNEQNPGRLVQTTLSTGVNTTILNGNAGATAQSAPNQHSATTSIASTSQDNTPEPANFGNPQSTMQSNQETTEDSPKADANESITSSNIISSNFYSLSERNLILLLALSKKFANLDLVDGKLILANRENAIGNSNLRPVICSSKISNYLLIWGTISNIKFPVILNLNKILTLSTIESRHPNSNQSGTVFSSALFYAVLAFGAAEFGQFNDCLKLFNTCWSLILPKMSRPEEIIEPLTILGYISFNYLQELYYFKGNNQVLPSRVAAVSVSIHTIFQCLNEVIYNLISEYYTTLKQTKSYHGSISLSTINYYKSHGLPIPPELLSQEVNPNLLNSVGRELFNYWYAYNLLSTYSLNFGKSSPKIHSIFLKKILPTNNDYHFMSTEAQIKTSKPGNIDFNKKSIDFIANETLKDALNNLSKSPSLLRNLISGSSDINSLTNSVFPANTFKNLTLRENCIIMGLSNELQSIRLNEANLYNNNRNSLHNAIIMANKSLNVNSNYQQFSTSSKTFSTGSTTAPDNANNTEYSLFMESPYSAQAPSASLVSYLRNVSTFGSKSHGVHSPNEPNLNIVNNTTINSNSNYLFNVNNFSNMLVNSNINQDLINICNLIIILKKKVLINCENKLIQDLLIDYIIIPNHEIYWNLLYITIKEFTFSNSDFIQWNEMDDEAMKDKFQQSYMNPIGNLSSTGSHLHGSASFSNGAYGIGPYVNDMTFNSSFNGFSDLIHDIMREVNINDVVSKITKFVIGNSKKFCDNVIINNNLGLASLPLLFIGYLINSLSPQNLVNEGFRTFNLNSPEDLMMNFLNLNAGSMSNNSLVFLKYFLKLPKNFVNLLIEDFLILIKVFYSLKKSTIAKSENDVGTKENNNASGLDGGISQTSRESNTVGENDETEKVNTQETFKASIEKIVNSPILESIVYLIREMGSDLKNDDVLGSDNVNPAEIIAKSNNTVNTDRNLIIDGLVDSDDDVILYFYLKNIEIIFISWLNFLNFGNNQFIQNNNNAIDNYLTRLIKYVQLSMAQIYETLDIKTKSKERQRVPGVGISQNHTMGSFSSKFHHSSYYPQRDQAAQPYLGQPPNLMPTSNASQYHHSHPQHHHHASVPYSSRYYSTPYGVNSVPATSHAHQNLISWSSQAANLGDTKPKISPSTPQSATVSNKASSISSLINEDKHS